MRRAIPALFIIVFILTACGETPAILGTYSTPTAAGSNLLPFTPDPAAVVFSPDFPSTQTAHTSLPTPEEPSATPTVTPNGNPLLEPTYTPTFDTVPFLYYTQSGDTLSSLALRFNVDRSEISSSNSVLPDGLIDPGVLLVIPD